MRIKPRWDHPLPLQGPTLLGNRTPGTGREGVQAVLVLDPKIPQPLHDPHHLLALVSGVAGHSTRRAEVSPPHVRGLWLRQLGGPSIVTQVGPGPPIRQNKAHEVNLQGNR